MLDGKVLATITPIGCEGNDLRLWSAEMTMPTINSMELELVRSELDRLVKWRTKLGDLGPLSATYDRLAARERELIGLGGDRGDGTGATPREPASLSSTQPAGGTESRTSAR
jgi:hypothetical protein